MSWQTHPKLHCSCLRLRVQWWEWVLHVRESSAEIYSAAGVWSSPQLQQALRQILSLQGDMKTTAFSAASPCKFLLQSRYPTLCLLDYLFKKLWLWKSNSTEPKGNRVLANLTALQRSCTWPLKVLRKNLSHFRIKNTEMKKTWPTSFIILD